MATGRRLPLSERKNDYVFIVFFVLAFVIALTVDSINVINDAGGVQQIPGQPGSVQVVLGITKENTKHKVWPPQYLYSWFFWWCETADPLLQVNPIWLKAMAVLSPCIFAPFYVYAIYCFVNGVNSVRIPCLIFSFVMANNLIIIFIEAAWGSYPSHNLLAFAAAYGGYLAVPLLLIVRMWSPEPFSAVSTVGQRKKGN